MPLTFYDIASAPPRRTFAANPWKVRLALNYKDATYRTEFVEMPDISRVRESLGARANRTLPDGKPFYTLPVVKNDDTGQVVGDSFEIAMYLDSLYPERPKLIDPSAIGLTAAFNAHVDRLFTNYAILCDRMPFAPEVLQKVVAIFAERAGSMAVSLQLNEEQREQKMVSLEHELGELAKAYHHTGGTTDYFWRAGGTDKAQSQHAPAGREEAGPWLETEGPMYADFIVGAWLKMFETSMSEKSWARVRTFQGGLWGRVADSLQKWSEIK